MSWTWTVVTESPDGLVGACELVTKLSKKGYEILNAEGREHAYAMNAEFCDDIVLEHKANSKFYNTTYYYVEVIEDYVARIVLISDELMNELAWSIILSYAEGER